MSLKKNEVVKHEWLGVGKVSVCPYCKCERVDYSDDATRYYNKLGKCTYIEPKCVTRKIESDGKICNQT